MPVRVMVEDALSYDRQMKKLQKQNREKGVLNKKDYISSLTDTDVLTPVVTIVIYYGEEPWNNSKDIYDILAHKDLPEEIKNIYQPLSDPCFRCPQIYKRGNVFKQM